MTDGGTDIRTALRTALRDRMVDRDKVAVEVLRVAIAAIENAEAQPLETATQTELNLGATASTDVARREVVEADARRLVSAEIEDLLAAADSYRSLGQTAAVLTATRQAEILRSVLGLGR